MMLCDVLTVDVVLYTHILTALPIVTDAVVLLDIAN